MDLGALGPQGGGRTRTQMPNDTEKTASGSEGSSLQECLWKLAASFVECFVRCVLASFFFACTIARGSCMYRDITRGHTVAGFSLLHILSSCLVVVLIVVYYINFELDYV